MVLRFRPLHLFLIYISILFGQLASAETLPKSPDSIRVGVIAPFSGEIASYGDLIRKGVEAGISSQIELIFEDDGCNPAKAVAAFHKLHQVNNVDLIIGPCCGSAQHAVAALLPKTRAIALLPSSASSFLFEQSGRRVFSSQYSIEQESQFNAARIFEDGNSSIVIILSENQFSRAHEAAFRAAFQGKILKTISVLSSDANAIRNIVLQVRRLKPDALYVPDVIPFFAGLLTQLKLAGLNQLKVYSIYSAQSKELLTAEGPAATGLKYSYPDIAQKDALSYFPQLAAELLSNAALACGGNSDCVRDRFLKDKRFDSSGVITFSINMRSIGANRLHPWE